MLDQAYTHNKEKVIWLTSSDDGVSKVSHLLARQQNSCVADASGYLVVIPGR